MMHHRDDSCGPRLGGHFANALRRASLLLCLSIAVARPALSDVVRLKNGELIKCKVVKEMNDIVKVRMPHRGRIVTTFLNKGLIQSIDRAADAENRKLFQEGGVHNPGRTYEPVYYSGAAPALRAAVKPGVKGAVAAAKGKAKAGTTSKKRGVEARRERSEARAKKRASRFGERTSKSSPAAAGVGATTSAPAAPSTSQSSGTTVSSFGSTGTSISVR